MGYVADIEKETLKNSYFRRVLFTAKKSQLVVMSLRPKEEIGMEVHPVNDQFIRIESGSGKAVLSGKTYRIKDGYAVVVPAGTWHNIVNTSGVKMKLYTVYSPAHHPKGTIHKTKADAEAAERAEHSHKK